jgi:excinuclease UvrABC nuclease subunit
MALDLKQVPNTPGIYKFFSKNKIIYIGKAKDLKKEYLHILVNLLRIEKHNKLKFLQIKLKLFQQLLRLKLLL